MAGFNPFKAKPEESVENWLDKMVSAFDSIPFVPFRRTNIHRSNPRRAPQWAFSSRFLHRAKRDLKRRKRRERIAAMRDYCARVNAQ